MRLKLSSFSASCRVVEVRRDRLGVGDEPASAAGVYCRPPGEATRLGRSRVTWGMPRRLLD